MKKIVFIILATFLGMISCNKEVLNKVPLDIISDNAVWSDQTLIDAFLTQCYSQMYILTNETYGGDWNTGESWFAPFAVNVVSDECKNNWATLEYSYAGNWSKCSTKKSLSKEQPC